MGVDIGSAKGHRRSLNANLNLVPFIDLLSVCITFRIATAVWVEPSSMPVVLVTDDGVSYGDMILALDLTRRHGFEQTLLGGGSTESEQ